MIIAALALFGLTGLILFDQAYNLVRFREKIRAGLVAIFAVLVLSAPGPHLWPILTDTALETRRAKLANRKRQISKLDADKDLLGIGAD